MDISKKLAALEQPSKFERLSVEHFFQHRQPLVLQENYMGNRADLVTLKAERDDAWLDNQILRFLVAANSRLLTVSHHHNHVQVHRRLVRSFTLTDTSGYSQTG